MRIKRVAIHGFKTFARTTEFIFDPGITAVVGPNGSGKSNIVDAMRWCLGEQSFSLLRSKKTSDVIFAGSDKRPRLGMAEVTITLDNSGGEIPIEYEEVDITRRAYRDGDNEYMVNGQRVRLQDVVELLSQTGLGKRTYSVVGQGLIDRALSMAPDERRSLFEEAAGITGYQVKRSTTMRRLEATQLNLTRIQDIVAELSPRLGYMRRQAERAHEREQLVRDLQALLRDWYGYRWHTTLRQLEVHHAAELSTRTAVSERQAALATVTARIDGVRGRQRDLRTQLADLHASSSTLHRQAESVDRDLAVSQERLRQIQARQEDARRDVAPIAVQQESLAARLGELQTAVAETKTAWSERQAAVTQLQEEVGQRQQQRARLVEALDMSRRELKRVQDQLADHASRLAQVDERRVTLHTQQEQQHTALANALREVAAAEEELRTADTKAVQADAEAGAVQQAIVDVEALVIALRGELRQAEEARQAADRGLDRLQTRNDLLSRLRQEGTGYGTGVRAVLQSGRSGALSGVLGTVATLLRVPPEMEKAIETALGGALQNVVTETWTDASAAIDYLKQQRAGRATFLPLDRLQVLPAITAPRAQGIRGNAVDLVEFDDRVAPAMEQLLNRVWVADNLPAARAALDRHGSGPRPTVVTLEGEIVRPGGAVSGGSDNTRGDDSLLARERELRELPKLISQAMQTARQTQARTAELNAQIEAGRLRVDQQQRLLADMARQEKQQRQRLEEMRRRVDRAGQNQRWQEERLAQTAAELETLATREQTLAAAQVEWQQTAVTAQIRVAQDETAVTAAGADDLLQELANRRTAAAETQGNLRSQEALLESTSAQPAVRVGTDQRQRKPD